MDCLTGNLQKSRYNLLVKRHNIVHPLTYEVKKKGSIDPRDHYGKRFLENVQIARQDCEFCGPGSEISR